MPLYSTETRTNTIGGKTESESETNPDAEGRVRVIKEEEASWHYLFVHRAKIQIVSQKMEERFGVFVHKSIVYKRGEKRVQKEERPTISGLLFVQGDVKDIQLFLLENFFGLYLVKDCSTGRVATISNKSMHSFMQMSQFNPSRIRFMPHPFGYYAKGNPLVRITSGLLSGLEGYRIRIARDKCFITSLGGMTVAIGGVYKENFENLDEYVRLRREQLLEDKHVPDAVLTPVQEAMDRCFFTPQTQLDVLAMVADLSAWVAKMQTALQQKGFDEAVEMALFMLDEIGSHFRAFYTGTCADDLKDITAICRESEQVLAAVAESCDVPVDLKEVVAAGRESLMVRFPFLIK